MVSRNDRYRPSNRPSELNSDCGSISRIRTETTAGYVADNFPSHRGLSGESLVRVWSVIQSTSQVFPSIVRVRLFKVSGVCRNVRPSIAKWPGTDLAEVAPGKPASVGDCFSFHLAEVKVLDWVLLTPAPNFTEWQLLPSGAISFPRVHRHHRGRSGFRPEPRRGRQVAGSANAAKSCASH
jgi:hypothetical protein